jgi:anti-anti-sigma regulatory factor
MTVRFGVEVGRSDQPATLALVGELDQAGVADLETMFRWVGATRSEPNVLIDISALEFCDSAGWHALERCRAAGATLLGSPPCLRRLFYLMKHAHLLPADLHELRGLEHSANGRPAGRPIQAA